MSGRSQRRSSSKNVRLALIVLVSALFLVICFCVAIYAAVGRLLDNGERATPVPTSSLTVAYSPEKEQVFTILVDGFNAQAAETPDGERMRVDIARLDPEAMIDAALDSSATFQA